MKLNFIKKSLLLFALSIAIISCDDEDRTGDSQLVPSSPTVSITLDFPNPSIVLEDDTEYTFTVSLSETQIVDTRLHLSQVGGTANADDYSMTSLVVIPAGYTSATGSITIIADELAEDVETLTIQVGDQSTANASLTPATVSFTISNATSADLVVGLSWEASEIATDNSGEEISATDLADMRLLVTDSPYTTILGGVDGGSFESYEFSGANADGEYLIVADFYAAMEDEDLFRDLNLEVTFDQIGVINHLTYNFPAVINTGFVCAANYTVLAKVIKTGENYDISPVGETNSIDVEGDWTIVMVDSWGDGWNGGFLTVTIDGVSTDYAAAGTGSTEVITVPAGASLVITYTAGDYEGENSFTITAPDGTIYASGPPPTVGTVIDSSDVCS